MEKRLRIEGMSCQHCVGRVKRYLESLPGVSDVNVRLDTKNAVFRSEEGVDMAGIIKAIDEFGFTASER